MKRLLLLLLAMWCAVACGYRPKPAVAPRSAVFLPALPPAGLLPAERAAYMRDHYWDRFDFADTLFLARADTMQMLDAFASYVAQYVRPNDPAPVDSLMRRASSSRPMLEYFRMLADRVLADPNSPLRSDELYIPVLRAVLAAEWYDRWERIAPEHDLRLALQNRVGQAANDFRYMLASGAHGTLYDVQAQYTLLFFSNPGCSMCSWLCEEITASPRLNEMTERGDLKVLMIYPDENLDLWRSHAGTAPAAWIDACDEGGVILRQELYDLKAIPALYLLDRGKRVLVKNSVSIPQIEEAIDSRL